MANEDVQNADAMNANNSISNINTSTKVERLKSLVKSYPDFPKPGILFRYVSCHYVTFRVLF